MDSKNLSCEQHFYSHEVIKQQMAELNANSTDKDFVVDETSVVMCAVGGMGVVINTAAAIFLSHKLKKHYSPFLRYENHENGVSNENFFKKSRVIITLRLLRALALSDLCVMVTGTLLHGLPGISSKYLNVIQPMIAPYLLPLAQISIMTSVYLAVVMAFERYIRICFICQLRSTQILTEKNLWFYIWACVLFPVLFYIPKWFELESEFILKPACQTLGGTYEGLIDMLTGEEMGPSKKQKLVDMINCLNVTLSRNCWNSNWTPIQEKMTWKMKHAPIRYNKVYYVTYYLTLNTLFATVLPIGALLFFSLSTVNGLASIRKSVRTSIPMRMSSSRITKSSMRNRSHTTVEVDPLTTPEESRNELTITKSELVLPITPTYKRNSFVKETKTTVAEPSAHEKRLTRISIILIFIYILCHMWKIPPSIYEAWYLIYYGVTTEVPWPPWLDILNDISHVLIQANSAFNFIIYLVL